MAIEHVYPTATCAECGSTKPIIEFRTDRTKPRNRDTKCKVCTTARDRARFQRNYALRAEAIEQGHRRICRVCNQEKMVQEFPPSGTSRGGSSSECQACTSVRWNKWRANNLEHVRSQSRKQRRKDYLKADVQKRRDAVKKFTLKRLYGLTPDGLVSMKMKQAHKCAICDVVFSDRAWGKKAVNVDHDHATGAVRELLCSGCNNGLGCFGDDENMIARALAYLRKHRERVA